MSWAARVKRYAFQVVDSLIERLRVLLPEITSLQSGVECCGSAEASETVVTSVEWKQALDVLFPIVTRISNTLGRCDRFTRYWTETAWPLERFPPGHRALLDAVVSVLEGELLSCCQVFGRMLSLLRSESVKSVQNPDVIIQEVAIKLEDTNLSLLLTLVEVCFMIRSSAMRWNVSWPDELAFEGVEIAEGAGAKRPDLQWPEVPRAMEMAVEKWMKTDDFTVLWQDALARWPPSEQFDSSSYSIYVKLEDMIKAGCVQQIPWQQFMYTQAAYWYDLNTGNTDGEDCWKDPYCAIRHAHTYLKQASKGQSDPSSVGAALKKLIPVLGPLLRQYLGFQGRPTLSSWEMFWFGQQFGLLTTDVKGDVISQDGIFLPGWVRRVEAVNEQAWFYGFCTAEAARKMLTLGSNKALGSFMVRFSDDVVSHTYLVNDLLLPDPVKGVDGSSDSSGSHPPLELGFTISVVVPEKLEDMVAQMQEQMLRDLQVSSGSSAVGGSAEEMSELQPIRVHEPDEGTEAANPSGVRHSSERPSSLSAALLSRELRRPSSSSYDRSTSTLSIDSPMNSPMSGGGLYSPQVSSFDSQTEDASFRSGGLDGGSSEQRGFYGAHGGFHNTTVPLHELTVHHIPVRFNPTQLMYEFCNPHESTALLTSCAELLRHHGSRRSSSADLTGCPKSFNTIAELVSYYPYLRYPCVSGAADIQVAEDVGQDVSDVDSVSSKALPAAAARIRNRPGRSASVTLRPPPRILATSHPHHSAGYSSDPSNVRQIHDILANCGWLSTLGGIVSTEVEHRGWVVKRGKIRKSWKARFMLLTRTHLLYFKSEDVSSAPRGALSLDTVVDVRGVEDKRFERQFCFQLECCSGHGHRRDYYFQCNDVLDRQDWMNRIKAHCSDDV